MERHALEDGVHQPEHFRGLLEGILGKVLEVAHLNFYSQSNTKRVSFLGVTQDPAPAA